MTASSTPGPAQPDAAPGKPARDGSLRDALGWSRPNLPLAVVAIAAAAALPLLRPNDYLLHVLVIAFIYMMVNQAWNLVLGVSGIWSFAQVAIFAIGGYTSGLLALHLGLSPWISMPIGGLFAMLVGIMLGIPAFRLTGIYVALLTFAFNEVVRLLIITDDRNGLTGGAFGLGGLPGFFDAGAGKALNYWLALVLLVIVSVIVHRIMYSPIGLAFGSLRENSRYAVGRGIDPFRYQLVVFGLSSFLTGIAGAFYAHYLSIIQPQIMGLALSTNLVAMIVIGGLGTFAGPIVGTGVLVFLLEFLRVTEQLRFIFLGIVLLLIIVAMPDGLVGGFSRARIALSRWIAAGDRATAEDPPDALSSDVESGVESDVESDAPPPVDPEARP